MEKLKEALAEKDYHIHKLENKNRRLHERIAKLKEQLNAALTTSVPQQSTPTLRDTIEDNHRSHEQTAKLKNAERKPVLSSQEQQIQQLTTQLHEAESKNRALETWAQALDSENKRLTKREKDYQNHAKYYKEQLEKKKTKHTVEQLQRKGKLCNMNCVRLGLHWIVSEKKLKYICCSEQLGNIITAYAIGKNNIEKAYMQCDRFMDILLSCNIIDHFEPLDSTEIGKAWSTLESMKKELFFLAKTFLDCPGHVIVCEMYDGGINFHDPAASSLNEQSGKMSLEYFKNFVKESQDVGIFKINHEELDEVVNDLKKIMHITCENHSGFGITPQEN